MKAKLLLAAASCLAVVACSENQAPEADGAMADATAEVSTTNVLLEEWDTPFGVPPLDRIASEDYLPAIRAGMEAQNREIEAIATNTETATFENTIEALEFSGASLLRANRLFSAVNGAHSNDVLKETGTTLAPELSAHRDNIRLNKDLFERVLAVHEQRDSFHLNAEQERLLDETHKQFMRAGANLPDEAQDQLREINSELAALSQDFRNNLLSETNEYELLVTNVADLGDLPANLVALAADEAKRRGHDCECWSFNTQRPSTDPFLQYSPNRDLRKQVFDAYAMRGDNDNEADNKVIASRMAQLRVARATLMGYDNHAEFVLSDNMAETPENVYGFLEQIWEPALRVAKQERADLEAMMKADGVDDRLRGWDWRYYTEKVRLAKYDLDDDALRPYFEVNAVRDGVFALATELFGLQFEQRDDLPTWHPDQQVFEVKEADGSHLAILYMDFFARDSKRGGAWAGALRSQENVDSFVTPIITNNFNFPAPTANSPSLLSLENAETLFHEFGHALHGMFSDVTYRSLSGTNTPRDFVEFPSQVMENWMRTPQVLGMFAKHYETGEPMPDDR